MHAMIDMCTERNCTQEAAKNDSEFSSSSDLVDANASLSKREKWESSKVSGGL